MPRKYKTSNAFKTALNQRIRNRAEGTDRSPAELQREFFMQRFLARVFAEPGAPWVLKGGGGLLVRIPTARHSKDIDLFHREADLDQAVSELEAVGARSVLDPFTFDIEVKRSFQGTTQGVELNATVYFGTTELARPFPIDLATRRELIGEIDYINPVPVVELPDMSALPPFAVYPLADQVADKVAAMYELHGTAGTTASTRWRDLVDLLLIIHAFPLDAATTLAAIKGQFLRRGIAFPNSIYPPGVGWKDGYSTLARKTALPAALHRLEPALERLGTCLNPILVGSVTDGVWDPMVRRWEPFG